jgi:hypothetical protein
VICGKGEQSRRRFSNGFTSYRLREYGVGGGCWRRQRSFRDLSLLTNLQDPNSAPSWLRELSSRGPTLAGCRPVQHRASMVHSVSKANEQQLEFMQRSSSASTIGVFALFQRLMGHVTSNLNMRRLHHRQSTALNHFFDPTLRSEAVHRHTHLPTYLLLADTGCRAFAHLKPSHRRSKRPRNKIGPMRRMRVARTGTWYRSSREDSAQLKSSARNMRGPIRKIPQMP